MSAWSGDRTLRGREDSGVTLILVALMMVALLTIVAIVVDIALVRSDRRTNQSVADFTSTAGVRDLGDGPWAGVCSALDYLAAQDPAFASLTVSYSDGDSPLAGDPCVAPASHGECVIGDADTWARLVATSADGFITVQIESPYDPTADATFTATETAYAGDAGLPCEQIGVHISELKQPTFSRVIGADPITSSIRSVARRHVGDGQEPAALILLERHDCNTLQTGGSNTRVIAQARDGKPGIMQIDSDGFGACTSQPIINGQSTASGPSIVACGTHQTLFGCTNVPGLAPQRDSITGVYAALVNPSGNIAPAFSGNTYGDTPYQPADQFTREPVDLRYGQFVVDLDEELVTAFTGAANTPPGCSAVDAGGNCTAGTTIWRVVSGAQCNDAATAAASAGTAVNVWFDCGDFTLTDPLVLADAQRVAFNGALTVRSLLHVPNAREVFVEGTTNGSEQGLRVGNAGNLVLNAPVAGECSDSPPAQQNVLAVLKGSYSVGSGGRVKTCGTFAYLASDGGNLPTDPTGNVINPGTAPCPSTDNTTDCDDYNGSFSASSGSVVDWSALDARDDVFCRPDLPPTTPCHQPSDPGLAFEDLGLWSEHGGSANSVNGGGGLSLVGVFFLPNAKPFSISGNAAQLIRLNAQFIVRELHASGGAQIHLVPDPNDSLTIPTPEIGLVR